jgi:hypothetical protein
MTTPLSTHPASQEKTDAALMRTVALGTYAMLANALLVAALTTTATAVIHV